jgi:hypothetical protein
VPFFPSDVIRNVSSSVDSGEITLAWDDPETIEPEAPIVQYYIEYKIFNLYNISDIPAGNILGNLSGLTMISNTIQDMKNILVDDVLFYGSLIYNTRTIQRHSIRVSYRRSYTRCGAS